MHVSGQAAVANTHMWMLPLPLPLSILGRGPLTAVLQRLMWISAGQEASDWPQAAGILPADGTATEGELKHEWHQGTAALCISAGAAAPPGWDHVLQGSAASS
jgi:hypothetical protein